MKLIIILFILSFNAFAQIQHIGAKDMQVELSADGGILTYEELQVKSQFMSMTDKASKISLSEKESNLTIEKDELKITLTEQDDLFSNSLSATMEDFVWTDRSLNLNSSLVKTDGNTLYGVSGGCSAKTPLGDLSSEQLILLCLKNRSQLRVNEISLDSVAMVEEIAKEGLGLDFTPDKFTKLQITTQNNQFALKGKVHLKIVSNFLMTAKMSFAPDKIIFYVEKVKVGFVSVRTIFLNWLKKQNNSNMKVEGRNIIFTYK